MGQGIAEVLTFAVGVAISPVPIIAVILMLFSSRAKVNGPMFLIGWAVALAVVSVVASSCAGDAASDEHRHRHRLLGHRSLFGALLLLLAVRNWRNRARRRGAAGACRSGWPASTRSHPARRSSSACCSPA